MGRFDRESLDWVDIDCVIEAAVKRFRGSAQKMINEQVGDTRVEPTLALFRATLTGTPLEDSAPIDQALSLTKTLQNAVGLFHQDVLGLVPGWESTGTSGGVVDIKGISPVTGQHILAEVKMRHNTIKAVNEKDMWDKLKDAVSIHGGNAAAYLFQIIPERQKAYDQPWAPSGRTPNQRVRHADGMTAYHLVTGHEFALLELLEAMPCIAREAVGALLGSSMNADLAFANSVDTYRRLITESLPAASAHHDPRPAAQ